MKKYLLKKTEGALENLNHYLDHLKEINVYAAEQYYSNNVFIITNNLISEGNEFKQEILRVLNIVSNDENNILDLTDSLAKINTVNKEILNRIKKLNCLQ